MSSFPSLLDNVSRSQLRLEPFPHYVIENALPIDTYAKLSKSFPSSYLSSDSSHVINDRGHTRRLLARNFPLVSDVPQTWCDFADVHTHPSFFRAVTSFFLQQPIEIYYPGLLSKLQNLDISLRSGEQSIDSNSCLTDFQLVANLPHGDNHSSRSPHLDNPQQLYAILYYMRSTDDQSIGGGLKLYSASNCVKSITHGRNRSIDEQYLTPFDLLPYKSNTAILFLNTRKSYHSVQPIFSQSVIRRSVNIIGELPPGSRLFKI